MRQRSLHLKMPILAVLLAAWLVGFVYISSQRWLLDTAGEPRVDLISGETRILPGTHRSRSVLRLAVIELESGPDRLLVLRAASGPGFVLQLVDRDSQQPVRTVRYPARLENRDYAVVLEPDVLPRRLRIDLRGRSSEDLTIEAAVLATLPSRVDWIPRLFRWLGPILVVLFLLWQRVSFVSYFLSAKKTKTEAPTARWDLLTGLLVFVGCFLVFRAAPVQQLIDSKFTTAVSHYLMIQGTFSLPPEFAPTGRANETYILQAVGNRTYHFFSDAPSVLNIPFVAAFEQFGIASVAPDGRFLRENERRILVFVAAFLAATLCSVLFLTARLWLPPPWALGLVMVFAFGSQIFSVMSRAYWSHSWAVLLLALAILLLVIPRFEHQAWIYVTVSSLLCWAYFCRPPLSLSIVAVTLYFFLRRRKYLLHFLTTGLVWATLFVAYSLSNFDSVLPPYFLSSHLRSGRLAGGILLTSYPSAMLGTLFSPGRGLFVYVPMLLVILFVVIRRWRWVPDKTLAVTALAVCVAQWQLVSLFRNWWGGQCFGPRLMSDVLPWFFLLGVLAVAALRAAGDEGRFQWSAVKVIGLALVVAASIFVNTRGAIARETAHGAGIWNWRYPQFMAGLIPRPNHPPQP